MKPEDYTIEYCPYCDEYVAIRSHGVTACPSCGKPLAPCSVCFDELGDCDYALCPYGCKGAGDDVIPITNPPMTAEEIAFAEANCL